MMNMAAREYISKTAIDIHALASKVWDALIKPEIAKKYFYGAEIISDWKEGNPNYF